MQEQDLEDCLVTEEDRQQAAEMHKQNIAALSLSFAEKSRRFADDMPSFVGVDDPSLFDYNLKRRYE